LILVVMATHAFRWLPFPQTLATSVAVVAGYDCQLYVQGDMEPAIVLNNHFFFLSAFLLGAVASYHSERSARMSFLNALRADTERARNQALLENVFPAPVAHRLQHNPGPIAERFDDVSVIFIDLVDFTTRSATLSPEVLVAELDALFSELDDLAHAHGVEKIKTMGDAYMAVAGLPVPRADHAERMADLALAVLAHVQRRPANAALPNRVRVGIASGPAVAGVIGTAKYTYDLWGEPVTLASRMQLHGSPDRIQVTDAFRRRLQDTFEFEYRGLVDVKGRGPSPTWWLTGRKRTRTERRAPAATSRPSIFRLRRMLEVTQAVGLATHGTLT
jgi:class 3 adenylate cyclase